jgi:hypothetical protein
MAPFEREIMDLKDLFKPEEIEKGYQWCQDKGLMPKYCPDCNEVMELSCKIKDDTCLGYCSTCQSTCNALTGTWFEISGMDPWSAIALLFYWSVGYSYPQTASRLGMTAADARAAYAKCVRFSEESMALCKDELYVDAPPHHYLEHQHQTCPLFKIGGKGKKAQIIDSFEQIEEPVVHPSMNCAMSVNNSEAQIGKRQGLAAIMLSPLKIKWQMIWAFQWGFEHDQVDELDLVQIRSLKMQHEKENGSG